MLSYPINLLLEKRLCLVVGGGPVAARKVDRLLESDALVSVVAPEVVLSLKEHAEEKRIELSLRPFRKSDLDDVFLTFLASDDHLLNRQVLGDAQKRKILVCAVDNNWQAGDFLTPASCFDHDLQLTVATDGRSCGRAKAVKNYLARHLETLTAGLVLTSISVETAKEWPLDVNQFKTIGRQLDLIWGVREFILIPGIDCLELVALVAEDNAIENLITAVFKGSGIKKNGLRIRKGKPAFAYLWQRAVQAADCSGSIGRQLLVETRAPGTDSRVGIALKELSRLLSRATNMALTCQQAWIAYENYCRNL
ncbi:MAG: bifunctional precorrin-2 dehydrogenase/sirohydrochlorin ferrochelatase [Pseudomonadota bacterium]|nr:bifunctional precorrin-2 dehydrogenase/sirohydrochlorin ferrochelatase [Pseudomonadota bacterium]